MKIKIILVIICWNLLHVYHLRAQSDQFFYQMIFETKIGYNDIDKKSALNPNNFIGINSFHSLSQFYPVVGFKNSLNTTQTAFQAEAIVQNYNFERDSTLFGMQELYGQISFEDKHHLTVGKKRLDWGTGLIWNPTNFFIQKDPLRTQNRLEGIFMLNYTYIAKKGEWNMYLFPDKRISDFKMAAKYNYSGDKVDASISFLEYGRRQQFGMDLSYGGSVFTAYGEGVIKNFTQSYGIDTKGHLITPDVRNGKFYAEWVIGASVLLNAQLTLNAEYRYRGDQLSRDGIKIYKAYLPANTVLYDAVSIGKHSLFGNLTYSDLYSRWSIQCRNFYDPVSGQWIISPLGIVRDQNKKRDYSAEPS